MAGPAWAVEGAGGLGNLLAQQLVAAGEVVLDVQPKVAARVRLLASGNTNKNDPNDARSVAVAALRSPVRRPVTAENHTAVLKVWSKRYRDLGRTRTQVACRLHAVLADLVPGGFSREITAGQAAGLLRRAEPADAIARARCELAAEFLADLRRLDAQIRDTRTRLAAEVRASGSTLTGIFGVGPVIAAAILGAVGHVSRFADRDRFAAYNGTAPIEVSSGERKIHRLSLRGNRRLNHAIHMAAITQIRYKHSPGRLGAGLITAGDADPGAQRGEAGGGGLANTTGASGDQNELPRHEGAVSHGSFLPRRPPEGSRGYSRPAARHRPCPGRRTLSPCVIGPRRPPRAGHTLPPRYGWLVALR